MISSEVCGIRVKTYLQEEEELQQHQGTELL